MDRITKAALLIALVGVTGASMLAQAVLLGRARPAVANDTPAALRISPDNEALGPAPDVPVERVHRLGAGGKVGPVILRADRAGRITARFRFDARPFDVGRLMEVTMTARGASGITGQYRSMGGWVTPEWPNRPYSPWGAVREDNARLIADATERIRRLERLSATSRLPAAEKARIIPALRERLTRDRQSIAPDGLCPADSTPGVFGHHTRALGDHIFLGCHFPPGERVEATLVFRPLGTEEKRRLDNRPRLEGPRGR